MIPARFDYAAAESVEEAVALLQSRAGARVLAGGQDLLTQMKLRHVSPPLLVDLRKIASLRGMQALETGLRFGAMTTCTEIVASPAVKDGYQVLAEAADSIGDAQVRNVSTIGGNLASGDPASDLAAAVLALDATLQLAGPNGSRSIAAEQFFLGAFTTALESTETITALDLPAVPAGSGSTYEKVKIPANGYPLCGVAASVVHGRDGSILLCRLAITGVTAHPRRLRNVEAWLEGKTPTPATIRDACAMIGEGLTFITNLHGSGDYRGHLTTVLAERALLRAVERAQGR